MKITTSNGYFCELSINNTKKERKKEFWISFDLGGGAVNGIAISADELYAMLEKYFKEAK